MRSRLALRTIVLAYLAALLLLPIWWSTGRSKTGWAR